MMNAQLWHKRAYDSTDMLHFFLDSSDVPCTLSQRDMSGLWYVQSVLSSFYSSFTPISCCDCVCRNQNKELNRASHAHTHTHRLTNTLFSVVVVVSDRKQTQAHSSPRQISTKEWKEQGAIRILPLYCVVRKCFSRMNYNGVKGCTPTLLFACTYLRGHPYR